MLFSVRLVVIALVKVVKLLLQFRAWRWAHFLDLGRQVVMGQVFLDYCVFKQPHYFIFHLFLFVLDLQTLLPLLIYQLLFMLLLLGLVLFLLELLEKSFVMSDLPSKLLLKRENNL